MRKKRLKGKNRRGEEIKGKRLGEAWEGRSEWKSHRGQGGTLQASVGSSSSDTPTSKQPPAASPEPAVSISVTYALSSTLFTDATSRPCKERKARGLSTPTRRAEISVVVGGFKTNKWKSLKMQANPRVSEHHSSFPFHEFQDW